MPAIDANVPAPTDHNMPTGGADDAVACIRASMPVGAALLPLETSVGYNIRATHRLIQRALQAKIEPHGVTLGMWYFLRVLWEQDGVTQSELSQRVATREPTTLSAVRDMERSGIVRRVPHAEDRRKINIFLTEKGHALRELLLPLAGEVLDTTVQGLTSREITMLLGALACIRQNFQE